MSEVFQKIIEIAYDLRSMDLHPHTRGTGPKDPVLITVEAAQDASGNKVLLFNANPSADRLANWTNDKYSLLKIDGRELGATEDAPAAFNHLHANRFRFPVQRRIWVQNEQPAAANDFSPVTETVRITSALAYDRNTQQHCHPKDGGQLVTVEYAKDANGRNVVLLNEAPSKDRLRHWESDKYATATVAGIEINLQQVPPILKAANDYTVKPERVIVVRQATPAPSALTL